MDAGVGEVTAGVGATTSGPPPRAGHRRRNLLAVAAVVVVAAGLGAGIGYDQWLTHPNALVGPASSVGETGPITVGVSYAHDTLLGTRTRHGGLITLDRVQPVVPTNTADATITMELCRHRVGRDSVGSELLADTSVQCTSLVPVDHQSVVLSEIDTQVIAVVTAHRPGIVDVTGYRVTYHQGRRHQTETAAGYQFRWTASGG